MIFTLNNQHLIFHHFFEINGSSKVNIYKSDGKSELSLVKSIEGFLSGVRAKFRSEIYFGAGGIDGTELWRTDGTTSGTYQVKDIYLGSLSSYPSSFMPFDSVLVFEARDSLHGFELFTYRLNLCEGNFNQSVQSGKWNISSTWSCGHIPYSTENVIITNGTKVMIDQNEIGSSGMLITRPGSVLEINQGAIFSSKPN